MTPKQQYDYYRKRLLKEAQRGGLTAQEEKLLKIVELDPNSLNDKVLREKTRKVKAEFKRVRKTKKYKEERKLRNQLYKVINRYQKEELEREARLRLQNLPPEPDQLRGAFFKNLTYNKLMQEGITRHLDGKVIRFQGKEAVQKQIKSLLEASDPERKKQRYIELYIENLKINGFPDEQIRYTPEGKEIVRHPIQEFESYLQSLDPKVITYALDMGYIESIQFYYLITEDDIKAIIKKLDYYMTDEGQIRLKAQYELTEAQTKEMVKIIKKERKLKDKINQDITIENNFND